MRASFVRSRDAAAAIKMCAALAEVAGSFFLQEGIVDDVDLMCPVILYIDW